MWICVCVCCVVYVCYVVYVCPKKIELRFTTKLSQTTSDDAHGLLAKFYPIFWCYNFPLK